MACPDVARDLLQSNGSPVHIVVLSEFRRNIKDLKSAFQSRGISGELFFARKANKLPWFVTAAGEEGIGVDVASFRELKETLTLGLPPSKIVVTAIGKDRALISEAVKQGCLLIIDNADELESVRAIAQSMLRNARIGLRFSGFKFGDQVVFSRFGFPVDQAGELFAAIGPDSFLNVEVLHAHLDRYDTQQRACALRRLIEIRDYALSAGHSISSIDLGGGILMRYLDSRSQWETFLEALVSSVRGDQPSFTYLADGFGFYRAGATVVGQANLYPAWNPLSKERFISAILDDSKGGVPLHRELSERGLSLLFEPGRALLDNVGMTLASVTFRKRDTQGNLLVGAAMNRTNVCPFRAEFCCDPILLATEARQPIGEGAFLVGSQCSEGDILFRRKLGLTFFPEPGDVLCFPNTAGYLTHFFEMGTHGNPLPRNLLLEPESWKICDVFE
jgi:diaminopimelate decarboxylase